MLFCCRWRNVETSCHKRFVIVFRHQQTPPLTTSDKCHNLPRTGCTVLITPSRSQHWQHAMKPDTGRKSRFLPTTPAFKVHIKGFPSEYCPPGRLVRKKLEWFVYQVRNFKDYVYSFRKWETNRRTYRRTDRHRMTAEAALAYRPIARQKLRLLLNYMFLLCKKKWFHQVGDSSWSGN